MFYILNQNEQIAAADKELLEALELNNLQELCRSILTNEIIFKKLNTHKIDIIAHNIIIKASYEDYELSTAFGDVILVKLSNIFSKTIVENFEDYKQERLTTLENNNLKSVKQKIVSTFLDDIPAIKTKDVPLKKATIFLDSDNEVEESIIDSSTNIKEPIPSVVEEYNKVESTLDNKFSMKGGLDLDSLIPSEPIAKVADQIIEEKIVEEKIIEKKKSTSSFLFEENENKKEVNLDVHIEEEKEFTPISLDAPIEDEEEKVSVNSLLLDIEEEDEEEEEEFTPISLDAPIEDEEEKVSVNSLLLDIEEEEDEEEEEFTPISLDAPIEDVEEEVSVNSLLLDIEEDEEEEEELTPISLDAPIEDEEEEVSINSLLLDIEEEDEEEEEEFTSISLDAPIEDVEEEVSIDSLLLDIEKEDEEEEEEFTPISLDAPIEEEVSVNNLLLDIEEEAEEDIEEFNDLLLEIEKEPTPILAEEPKEDIEEFDDLLLDIAKEPTPILAEEPKEEIDEFDDLFGDTTVEKKVTAPQKPAKPSKVYECNDVIEINLDEYGEMMGISGDDYTLFLNEFIDKAIMCDEDLRSSNDEERKNAIDELYGIAQSLQIPHLEDILYDMLESDDADDNIIDAFFTCLGQIITISSPVPQEEVKSVDTVDEVENIEEKIIEDKIVEEKIVEDKNGFGVLSFDGIKPIHFDFRLEEAADDLSLPVDLIEEFVNDFIDQAIEEKETFIKAYQAGDLDTIQKTGHKLKGASSNLRIVPLSETLEDIQHCEDPERLLPLLKKYWGQFLSFELFMQNISHN